MKRMTKQRQAILACLRNSKHPLSIEEILTFATHEIPHLNLATVYRNLKILLKNNEVIAVEVPGGSTRYETVNRDPHHHFHCVKCDKVYDVEGATESISLLIPQDYQVLNHAFFFRGYCPPCSP